MFGQSKFLCKWFVCLCEEFEKMADSCLKEGIQPVSRRDQLERWRNQRKQNEKATVGKTNKSDNARRAHPLTLKNPQVCGKRVDLKAAKSDSSKIKSCGCFMTKIRPSMPPCSQIFTRKEPERKTTNIPVFRPRKRLQSPISRAEFKTPSSIRHTKPSRTTSALKIDRGRVPHSLPKSKMLCPSTVTKYTCITPQPVASCRSDGSNCLNKVSSTPCVSQSDAAVTPFKTPTTKSHQNKALSMRERLELWLSEKGKTPKVSRYQTPATVKRKGSLRRQTESGVGADTPSSVHRSSKGTLSVPSEIQNVVRDVETFSCDVVGDEPPISEMEAKLQEYLAALQQYDCSYESIALGLDECQRSWPGVLRLALYWVCRAKLAELDCDESRVVCLLEQALLFSAQPESLIKDAVCSFVQSMKNRKSEGKNTEKCKQLFKNNLDVLRKESNVASPEALAALNTSRECPSPSPVAAPSPPQQNSSNQVDETEPLVFNSSIIKFCLSEATPYKRKLKSCFNKPILTPVRRSMRLEKASCGYPTMLQEHLLTVRSLDELPEAMKEEILYKPNMAVQAELNQAWMEMQQAL